MKPDNEPRYHLAQINVAHPQYSLDSPQMRDFVDAIDEVNALADNSPGFVWRHVNTDQAEQAEIFGEPLLVNISVWESLETLRSYVYNSAHLEVLRRKAEWFDKPPEAHLALWWVPLGHRPTLQEAGRVLQRLKSTGPGPEAFTFASPFSATALRS